MRFKYKAKDNNSGATLTGLVQAGTKDEAIHLVEDKGYTVLDIKISSAKKGFDLAILQRVTPKDLVAFYRALSMMLSSDVSIVESLKIISHQSQNPKLERILGEVYSNVNEGMRFSDALDQYSKIFGSFYIHMIRSGEVTGKLSDVLEYLADQQVKDYEFRSKIRGAMVYPIFVLSAMFLMGMGMLVFVIPRLTVMLEESGIPLPITTRMLIAASNFAKGYWYVIMFVLVGGIVGIRLFISKTMVGKKIWHKALMMMPLFGQKLIKKIYLVRLTRSLTTLITGGVPLVEALEIASSVVGNYYYEELLRETAEAVKDGNNIESVFAQHPELIPEMLRQLTAIGEQSGRVDQVFDKIGQFYAKEVDNMVQNISKMIEPIIMVILGAGVAFLVFSIMLPMFKTSQAVG